MTLLIRVILLINHIYTVCGSQSLWLYSEKNNTRNTNYFTNFFTNFWCGEWLLVNEKLILVVDLDENQ